MGRSTLVSNAGVSGRQDSPELPDPFGVAVIGFVIFLVGAWLLRGVISRILFKHLPRLLARVLELCRRSATVDQTATGLEGQEGQSGNNSPTGEQDGRVSTIIVDNVNTRGAQARNPHYLEASHLHGPNFAKTREVSMPET
jgi:hypothetical protein